MSYDSHFEEEKKKNKAVSKDAENGHAKADVYPDFDQVWKDFSAQLAKGDIKTDNDGRLLYELDRLGMSDSWWDRYKMHAMLAANVGMLWFMSRMRSRERREKQKA